MKISKLIVALTAVVFLFVGAAGVWYAGAMMGHGDMGMVGCPLMGYESAICDMDPLDHVSTWQSMFTALPAPIITLVLLLLAAALFFVRFRYVLGPPLLSFAPVRISYDSRAPIFDPLKRFIARGLLHPKIF